jgi:hypothetical protein
VLPPHIALVKYITTIFKMKKLKTFFCATLMVFSVSAFAAPQAQKSDEQKDNTYTKQVIFEESAIFREISDT